MTRSVAILRGINVGGKRKVLMKDLVELFQGMGFGDVKTYIQSGNVLFDSDRKTGDVEVMVEKEFAKRFGFSVPVIVRSASNLERSVERNPYYREDPSAVSQLHLTFLKGEPAGEGLAALEEYAHAPDEYVIDEMDVFIRCVGKYHHSKLANNHLERKLGVTATTRNWKTVLKLLELSKG